MTFSSSCTLYTLQIEDFGHSDSILIFLVLDCCKNFEGIAIDHAELNMANV